MASAAVVLPSGQQVGFAEQPGGTLAQQTAKINDRTVEGTRTKATAEGSEVVMSVVEGMTMLVVWFHGTYSTVTIVAEATIDGTHWFSFAGSSINAGTATANPLSSSSNSTSAWEAAIPAGATQVRMRCTAITSGTVELMMAQGSSDYETVMAAVISGTAQITALGVWLDLSSTTLAGNATFTSGTQEVSNQTTGVALGTLNTGGQGEVRISATSDKVGTLYLETSRDNATWTRVKGATLAKFDTTCENYAEIVHRPSERYFRVAMVNGAEAQTKLKVQCMKVTVA